MLNSEIHPNNKQVQNGDLELIRLPELCKLTTLKPSTVFKGIKNGSIPKPYKLLGRINCWSLGEVMIWIDSQRQ